MREELPSILISDGWETDENDKLTEVVIPSSVDTYQAPTKIKFLGETINWIPSTTAALQEFEAPNITVLTQTGNNGGLLKGYTALTTVTMQSLEAISRASGVYGGGIFSGCTNLKTVNMPSLKSIESVVGSSGSVYGGVFLNCTSLATINMPALTTITDNSSYNTAGTFYGCTALTSVSLPSLTTINNSIKGGVFYGCTSLISVSLPKIQSITSGTDGAFTGCTGLTTVTLGSVGNPVSSIGSNTFKNCTQSGLTITIYTNNGSSLSGEKWGATNATIVYESA